MRGDKREWERTDAIGASESVCPSSSKFKNRSGPKKERDAIGDKLWVKNYLTPTNAQG